MNGELYLKCKDYSISGEEFELRYDKELDMLKTYPVPELLKLGEYYESVDYISHTDSKKTIIDRVYQIVKNYAISNKVKLISSYCVKNRSETKLLDIGCGTGDFLLSCKNANFDVVGVEPNEKARELAESKLNGYVLTDLSDLKDYKFDVITMWHVLEHVPNLDEYLEKLKFFLKDKGTLIVAVPNYKSFDAKYYGKFWAAYDVPRHLSHFSRASIDRIFFQVGMYVKKELPMKFDAFYVSLLSEKYKNSFLQIFRAFSIGVASNFKAITSREYSSLIYVIKKK